MNETEHKWRSKRGQLKKESSDSVVHYGRQGLRLVREAIGRLRLYETNDDADDVMAQRSTREPFVTMPLFYRCHSAMIEVVFYTP